MLNNREKLQYIRGVLEERGYSPINQLVGFILTEDPTYITNTSGARQMAFRIDCQELLSEIITDYFQNKLGVKT